MKRVRLSPLGLATNPDLIGRLGTITETWPETETVSVAWEGGLVTLGIRKEYLENVDGTESPNNTGDVG